MPALSEPVPFWFILATIGVIFALIFIAILMIKKKKENL
jgi:hypothetical protein